MIYLEGMNPFKVPKSYHIENRNVRYTFYALFCVIVADGLITQFLVKGGHGWEANPFLKVWVGHELFLAIKISGAFLATLLLWIRYNARPRVVYSVAVVFLASYTSIVFWNLLVFFLTA